MLQFFILELNFNFQLVPTHNCNRDQLGELSQDHSWPFGDATCLISHSLIFIR